MKNFLEVPEECEGDWFEDQISFTDNGGTPRTLRASRSVRGLLEVLVQGGENPGEWIVTTDDGQLVPLVASM